jgi:small subunit ribosomal protein S4
MKYTGPKVRLSRHLGVALTPRAAKVMQRRIHKPGQHGPNLRPGRTKISDYGLQMLEKQKLRAQYNIHERQMLNYYMKATKAKGNSADNLMHLLESRLDALTLRAGFANTIYAARQLVNHGHIRVNGHKVDIPSYQLKPNDVITLTEKSRKMPTVLAALEAFGTGTPYLMVDKDNFRATYLALPNRADIPIICEVSRVVEFYSR